MSKRKPLTEEQWLSSPSADALLKHLQQHHNITKAPGGQRKLRLYAVAVCRTAWQHFTDERCRHAVEVGERLADGKAKRPEALAAAAACGQIAHAVALEISAAFGRPPDTDTHRRWMRRTSEANAAQYAATPRLFGLKGVEIVLVSVFSLTAWEHGPPNLAGQHLPAAGRRHADLVRDLFANPFRPVPAFEARWRTASVVNLAKAIYEERAFERLPILTDALMDAGCDAEDVLAHCRGEGPHARGCWVVDGILGKGYNTGG